MIKFLFRRVFLTAVVLGLVFGGYKYYLTTNIGKMNTMFESAKNAVQSQDVPFELRVPSEKIVFSYDGTKLRGSYEGRAINVEQGTEKFDEYFNVINLLLEQGSTIITKVNFINAFTNDIEYADVSDNAIIQGLKNQGVEVNWYKLTSQIEGLTGSGSIYISEDGKYIVGNTDTKYILTILEE